MFFILNKRKANFPIIFELVVQEVLHTLGKISLSKKRAIIFNPIEPNYGRQGPHNL